MTLALLLAAHFLLLLCGVALFSGSNDEGEQR